MIATIKENEKYYSWDEAREDLDGDTVIEYITIDGDGYLTTEI